jgi:hypothetical protein
VDTTTTLRPAGLLVGQMLLYWWPYEGWQHNFTVLLCQQGAFSHVVAQVLASFQTLWWPIPSRRWRCTALLMPCSTQLHMAPVGCFSPQPCPLPLGSSGPCCPTSPCLDFEFGL